MEATLMYYGVILFSSSFVLFVSAKIVQVDLEFGETIIVSIANIVASTLTGGVGTLISVIAYFGLMKLFTGATFFRIIILSIMSLALAVFIVYIGLCATGTPTFL